MPIDVTSACRAGLEAADDAVNPHHYLSADWRGWQFGRFMRERLMIMPDHVATARKPWLRVDGMLWAPTDRSARRWQRIGIMGIGHGCRIKINRQNPQIIGCN